MRIDGSVTVVTGGASGIGRAMCERFAELGAEAVVVVDRNESGAAEVADRIGGMAVGCDVGDEAAINELVARVEEQYGRIDAFCNNAGIANDGDILTTPLERWQQQWDVNVMAHVYASRAVLPGMLERGNGGAAPHGVDGRHSHQPRCRDLCDHQACGGRPGRMAVDHVPQQRASRSPCWPPLGVNTPMFAGSDSEWQRMAAGPVREPEEVAVQVSDAMTEGRFLILTDPIAQEWMERKTNDLERWLRGMRRLQDRMDELGITNAAVTDETRATGEEQP